jgi:hypothetical protein
VTEPPVDEAGPRLTIPNASRRWLTTVNYDLLVFDDRLVALKGLTLKGGAAQARTDQRVRRALGAPAEESSWARQRARDEERVAAAAVDAAVASSDRPDRIVVRFDDVRQARLTKRFGIVALRLTLEDGSSHRWMWMNNSMARRYAETAPVLRAVLGSRLR